MCYEYLIKFLQITCLNVKLCFLNLSAIPVIFYLATVNKQHS